MNQAVAPLAAKGVFIDNQWRPAASGRTLPMIAPAEGAAFAAIAAGDARDVDRAVAAARRRVRGRRLGPAQRHRARPPADQARPADRGPCRGTAAIEARDTGKPMKQARADMVAAARYFEYYGGAADKVHGDTIPFLPGYFVTTEHEPLGRHGPHHPVELPGADVRPHRRARAGDGQRLRGEAGRGRLPDAAAPRRTRRRRRASPRARSTSCRASARRRAPRSRRIPASTSSPSPAVPRSAR